MAGVRKQSTGIGRSSRVVHLRSMCEQVFVGRQPIYDRDLNLFAHELLFRSNSDNAAAFESGTQASSQVITNALFDLGLDRLAGSTPVFVNIPEDFITDRLVEILPAHRCVLEILENVVFNDEICRRLAQLKAAGYKSALDDFVYSEENDPVVDLVDFVKLDVQALDPATLAEHVRLIRRHPVKLVAEKIESQSEFRLCKELGFEYFQGYFLSRPEIIPGRRTPVDLATITMLLERCRDPLAGVNAIGSLIGQNVTLSYRLLQAANSALRTRRAEITSVNEAVLFLGTGFVARLASLFLLAGLTSRPSQCLLIALHRACACELLADSAHLPDEAEKGELYMVGLLSALDILLDQPIVDLISPLPLPDEVKDAIVLRTGPMGKVLEAVVAFENGDWPAVASTKLGSREVSNAYWGADPRVEELRGLLLASGPLQI